MTCPARPEGRAALARGIAEADLRGTRLVVVNATRGDALVDERSRYLTRRQTSRTA